MYSIVIPAYNEEKAQQGLMKRVLTSNPDAEMSLVDDGSTDKTWDIMKSLSDKVRIKAFRHQENKGKAQALKTAICS